jgi:hypothetical protein
LSHRQGMRRTQCSLNGCNLFCSDCCFSVALTLPQARLSTEIVRSKFYDSSSILDNPSLHVRQSMVPSAFDNIERGSYCGASDQIARYYTPTALGLTMKVVSKNAKSSTTTTVPKSLGKTKMSTTGAIAPDAFEATEKILDAAKTMTGKVAQKQHKAEASKPLPIDDSDFARREEHRLLRSSLPYSVINPKKIKSLDAYNATPSMDFNDWDPEPINESKDNAGDLTQMSINDRLFNRAKAVSVLMENADRLLREGVDTAAGSGQRLPIIGISATAIESIIVRIPTIPNLLESNIIQVLLNDEIVQEQAQYRLAIAKSCLLYQLRDPYQAKQLNIDVKHLHDDKIVDLWTNKHYQLKEWRVLRETGVDSMTVIKNFQRISHIHCNTLDIILDLQKLWFDGSLPASWWDGMIGMTKASYQNLKFVDLHETQFRNKLPMTLEDFVSHVDSRCRDIRDALLDYWITTAGAKLSAFISSQPDLDASTHDDALIDEDARMFQTGSMTGTKKGLIFNNIGSPMSTSHHQFSRGGDDGGNTMELKADRNKAERVIDTSCVLMSRQIRYICEESLETYAKLFEQLSLSATAQYSIFIINLKFRKLRTGELSIDFGDQLNVCLQPDLQDISQSMAGSIHNIVELSRGFTRPEQAFGQGFGGENRHVVSRLLAASRKKKMDEASVNIRDEVVIDVIKRTKSALALYYKAPLQLLEKFKVLDSLMKGIEMQKVLNAIESYNSSTNIVESLENLSSICVYLDELSLSIKNLVPDISYFPMFEVHCGEAKELLLKQVRQLSSLILDAVLESNRSHLMSIISTYQDIANRLVTEVADAAELRSLQEFSNKAAVTLGNLYEQYTGYCYERVKFLISNKHKFSRDDISILSTTFNWPLNIQTYIRRSYDMQAVQKRKLEELLEEDQRRAENELTDIAKSIETLASNVMDPQSKIDNIAGIRRRIEVRQEEMDKIYERETLLDIPHTDIFSRLEEVKASIEPLDRLWTTVKVFQDKRTYWKETPLAQIDADEEEKVSDELFRSVIKISKDFEKYGEKRRLAKNVADSVLVEVKDFIKESIPLMKLICNPGMRERHWIEIETLTGVVVPHQEVLRMDIMLEIGLQNYVKEIEDICVAAGKEYNLQTALEKMETEWKYMSFETKEYRETGTRILKSVDDIQQLLDDQIVKVHAMRSSRYVTPFLTQVQEWEDTLTSMQDILDNWLKVQVAWMYLEPIFSSDDIMRQMPTEGKMFRAVDNTWRVSMAQTHSEPTCVKVARKPGFLDSLVDANSKLEQIQKGLNDYLETKRLAFPRFFFLSNDELLEILSETKDPLRVQPHLKKCFDGISRLEFKPNLDIVACFDPKDERLDFPYTKINHKQINPEDSSGNVERWLIEVETVMKKSLAYTIDQSMKDFILSDRIEWLQRWQGQVVISVNQTRWCVDMEKIFIDGDSSGITLSGYHQYLCDELLRTVELVRGNISKNLRVMLSALVVMDVHNRDTTSELVSLGTKSRQDFDWLAQLRYYWKDDGMSSFTGKPGTMECRMINSMVLYAYEYIGNQDRLVITPLTDRCYRTLINAIHLNFFGAPEGPAGTGKTETTKDLAKAIAIQCVVTNCSDGLDYLAMAKFFKGLASSGSWACFDEFNRIQLEVLSVIAQQILQIQQAKIKGLTKFNFEGTDLELKPTCCPFITMNPGNLIDSYALCCIR